jgi:hypothetical protein
MATTQELYEDWKPLLEGQQDALVTVDIDAERESHLVEQTNNSRGISAGGPRDAGYPAGTPNDPLYKKIPHPAVLPYLDDEDDDGC